MCLLHPAPHPADIKHQNCCKHVKCANTRHRRPNCVVWGRKHQPQCVIPRLMTCFSRFRTAEISSKFNTGHRSDVMDALMALAAAAGAQGQRNSGTFGPAVLHFPSEERMVDFLLSTWLRAIIDANAERPISQSDCSCTTRKVHPCNPIAPTLLHNLQSSAVTIFSRHANIFSRGWW